MSRRNSSGAGCRSQLLVLPSVVCATRVARDIAEALGAVTITHQHGCSQVGDDGIRTSAAFEQIAWNPNVAAVLVVSLGCETMQGRALADRIREGGQIVEFAGIQEHGGSRAAVGYGIDRGRELWQHIATREREPVGVAGAVIGIEASQRGPLATDFARHALAEGAAVLWASEGDDDTGLLPRSRREPAFGGAGAHPGSTVLTGAGRGSQQHVALAAAGAHVIVTFTALDEAPVGFPICPAVAVAGDSPLHDALRSDFDLGSDASAADIWRVTVDVLEGAASAAEARGTMSVFALERLLLTM